MRILLDNIGLVTKFLRITENAKADIKLIGKKAVVDGKSIMGIFSLDLSEPITVEIDNSKLTCGEYTDLSNELSQFSYKTQD